MSVLYDGGSGGIDAHGRNDETARLGRARLTRELFAGRYPPGKSLRLSEMAVEYGLDNESVLETFREFQTLGMASLSGVASATIHSLSPKQMQEAYELRAALEEIAGRTAAAFLKANTATLQRELDAMRAAVLRNDLDAYAEHDVRFHRHILESSQNDVLLPVWDTLALDLRIRAAVGKASKGLPEIVEVVESHQSVVDALEKGRGREAGLLLRNHVETFLEYLKKSESDSGFHKALRKDLEGAKDVQQAFFPPETLSIPCLSCETFYQPAFGIGGDYYDFRIRGSKPRRFSSRSMTSWSPTRTESQRWRTATANFGDSADSRPWCVLPPARRSST